MIHTVIDFVKQYYWIPLLLVYIGVVLTILIENRNPSKSLAYILVLVLLPVVGLVVYFLFGRNMRKQKIFDAKSIVDEELYEQFWEKQRPAFEKATNLLEGAIGDLYQPFYYLFSQEQSIIQGGNNVKLLTNGEEKFPAVIAALKSATHHIHIEYYIFSDDAVGKEITTILMAKAKEGVEVKLIIDGVGSRMRSLVKRLRKSGVEVYEFMPVRFASLAQANYRNHRKIIVVDGKTGFVGGINMDDRYLNNGKHALYWRDTHLQVTGPAVNQLQIQFLQSYSFVSKKKEVLREVYFNRVVSGEGHAMIGVIASGPDSSYPYNMEALLIAINQAKRTIRITNPYFIPSQEVLTALELAISIGVEVEIILPGKSDSYIVQHASFSYLSPLIDRGVKVYLYQKGFVHAKTMLVDDALAFIGTVNMDIRSFYINFEIAAMVQEKELCSQMNQRFAEDKEDSELLNAQEWANRPGYKKLMDSVCRLLAPLL